MFFDYFFKQNATRNSISTCMFFALRSSEGEQPENAFTSLVLCVFRAVFSPPRPTRVCQKSSLLSCCSPGGPPRLFLLLRKAGVELRAASTWTKAVGTPRPTPPHKASTHQHVRCLFRLSGAHSASVQAQACMGVLIGVPSSTACARVPVCVHAP